MKTQANQCDGKINKNLQSAQKSSERKLQKYIAQLPFGEIRLLYKLWLQYARATLSTHSVAPGVPM